MDYLLSQDEVEELVKKLDRKEKELKELVINTNSFSKQYKSIEQELQPYFEDIVGKRERISSEDELMMYFNIDETLKELSEEEKH